MDIYRYIDKLMEKPFWLADIFPERVPEKPDGRYFSAERIFRQDSARYGRKFRDILLKLYCYYDMTAATYEEAFTAPEPEKLCSLTEQCIEENIERLSIVLPECDTLVTLDGGDLYMTVYSTDERCLSLIGRLARSEGLFFYKGQK